MRIELVILTNVNVVFDVAINQATSDNLGWFSLQEEEEPLFLSTEGDHIQFLLSRFAGNILTKTSVNSDILEIAIFGQI